MFYNLIHLLCYIVWLNIYLTRYFSDNVIVIVNIDYDNMYIVNTIQNVFRCYGISYCDGKLYCCHASEGIRWFVSQQFTVSVLDV
jgi:PhoPQ-activated pathogenicity-related protein